MRTLSMLVLAAMVLAGCGSKQVEPTSAATSAETAAAREQEIARLRSVVRRPGGGGGGDPVAGRQVFSARCAACHRLFGYGGEVGPDLTPYLRQPQHLDFLLTALIDPREQTTESHTTYVVTTTAGATYTGVLLQSEGENIAMALPGAGGNRVTISRKNIASMQAKISTLMPEHLMANLSDQQVRDLFAYLLREAPAR